MVGITIAALLAINAVVITVSMVENFNYFSKFKEKDL